MELCTGKTVVVSGGAEGIGFAVAQAVGREGMNVVITDISPDTLAKAEAFLFWLSLRTLVAKVTGRELPKPPSPDSGLFMR